MATKKLVVTKWKIAKLKEHPQQATIFGDSSEEDLTALAAHMEKHGLEKPVEILSDGTIVAGHQRVRAAKRLRWKEIDVVVRHDLEKAGASAIENHLINDNLIRRQLSPLGRARCIQRLLLLGQCDSKDELKRQIAKQLRMSPRNVNRYLLVLETPMVVQEAFDRGEVPLTTAGKVALLPESCVEELEERIQAGEDVAAVIAEYLAGGSADGDDVDRSLGRLLRTLQREIPRLADKVANFKPERFAWQRDLLEETAGVLQTMLARASETA